MKKLFWVYLMLLCQGCGHLQSRIMSNSNYEAEQIVFHTLKTDLDAINSGNYSAFPTVDLAIYISSASKITWEQMLKQLEFAKNIFKNNNVQLNLTNVTMISIPSDLNYLTEDQFEELPQKKYLGTDLYNELAYYRGTLSEKASHLFSSIVDEYHYGDPSRTIFIVVLNEVKISWFDDTKEPPELKTFRTGAFSFPTYYYQDRIPRALRGAITVQNFGNEGNEDFRVLAHELGHKLINVSHEGFDICPTHEKKDMRSLMLNGAGLEIPKGRTGRWHFERLHLSPFLYRVLDGEKKWNSDYLKSGAYDDPIYGSYVVSPSCGALP